MQAAHAGGALCGTIFAVVFITFVGAFLLRVGVYLFNTLAGGDSSSQSVPNPTTGKAIMILLVTFTIQVLAMIIMGIVIHGGVPTHGLIATGAKPFVQLISTLLFLFISALMLAIMLPTTFGRAVLVTFCCLFVCMIAGSAVVALGIASGVGKSKA